MAIQAITVIFALLLIFIGVGLIYTLIGESATNKPTKLLFIAGVPLAVVVTAYVYRAQIPNNSSKDIAFAVGASLEIAMLVISVVCGAVFSLAVTNRGALKRSSRLGTLTAKLEALRGLRNKSDQDIVDMLGDSAHSFTRDAFMVWHADRMKIDKDFDQKEQELLRSIEKLK